MKLRLHIFFDPCSSHRIAQRVVCIFLLQAAQLILLHFSNIADDGGEGQGIIIDSLCSLRTLHAEKLRLIFKKLRPGFLLHMVNNRGLLVALVRREAHRIADVYQLQSFQRAQLYFLSALLLQLIEIIVFYLLLYQSLRRDICRILTSAVRELIHSSQPINIPQETLSRILASGSKIIFLVFVQGYFEPPGDRLPVLI